MKIETKNSGKAVVSADDGAQLFEIVIDGEGEPSFTIRSVATGFRMDGVRYSGALDVRPRASNSVQITAQRHPNDIGGVKLKERT